MATTFVDYTGDGNATKTFSFPSIKEADVKVEVDGVIKTTSTHYNITSYTTTGGGNVVFTSGNIPASPAAIRIFRDTDVDTAKATYTAGSSVKAGDLNNNHEQLLFAAQEEQNQTVTTSGIKDAAVTTAKIKADQITSALIADDQINSEHYVDGSIDTAHIADLQVTTAKIAADAVTGAKIADDQINSEHYVDGSIDTAHIANSQITTDKLNTNAVTTVKITDANITTAKIADSNVTTAKIAADAVTGAKIADDQINSEHYVDGSIDTAHIADSQITSAKIADGTIVAGDLASNAVTTAKILDDNVTADKLAHTSVSAGSYTAADITVDAQGRLTSAASGTIATGEIADSAVTAAKIASNAVTTDKIQDGELTTLAGMQSTTASNLASATALTATTAELNQLDGITLETSLTSSDTRIPTSKAVNDQILAVTNALGGFVAIDNETSFPTANPDPSNGAGTVVSISQVSSGSAVSINSSGVATISNGAGSGNTVTITGFPTTLRNTSLAASSGLQVQTTTTLHTYTFHKQLASAADISAISATVNSFSARYRVSSSAPTSSLDGGDLWYDTTNSKLMVYSSQNSAWEESSAIGNFFISTISSSSSTGGGSATANGTAYRFTISNAPQSAQSLIVSVDGVVQKPNAGSSQPSEGYVLVGNDIIFGAAPANGASIFITVIGSTVGIGTPSDNTVTTAILQNGSVTTAKITDANVTTAKIADDAVTAAKLANTSVTAASYGSSTSIPSITVDAQGRITAASGNTVNTDLVGDTSPQLGGNLASNGNDIIFADNDKALFGTGSDLQIYHDGTDSYISSLITGALYQKARTSWYLGVNATSGGSDKAIHALQNAGVEIYYDNVKKLETTSSGATITGALTATGATFSSGVTFTGASYNTNWVSSANTMRFYDNAKAGFGNSDDLQIYHDGSNSYIKDSGTGDLLIRGSQDLRLQNADGSESFLHCNNGGDVILYRAGTEKLRTQSTGVQVTGRIQFTDTNSIITRPTGSALSVETGGSERLRINSSGNVKLPDNGKLQFGGALNSGDGDCQLFHDGGNLHFANTTGTFKIKGDDIHLQNAAGTEDYITTAVNGAVELFYNGSQKFHTTSAGSQVTGSLTLTEHLVLADGKELKLGNSSDMTIWHSGSDFNMYNSTGALIIANASGTGVGEGDIIFKTGSNSTRAYLSKDGHFYPASNNSFDLGTSSNRWRNVYTNDLNLSNEGHSNDVDGTWGNWTIQEGESDLFLKNNRSGKKYKFNLTEVL